MNLDGLFTRTTVAFNSSKQDSLRINNQDMTEKGLKRVSYILDLVREMAKIKEKAEVQSENNFSCRSPGSPPLLRPSRHWRFQRAKRGFGSK